MRKKTPLTRLSAAELAVAPSILAADFARLADDIERVEHARIAALHIDVMDGHFVPNLSVGPPVVSAIRPCTALPFDVHLMLSNPLSFIEPFSAAGADHITVHVEMEDDVDQALSLIRQQGCSVGLSLRPGTPASALQPFLAKIDLILIMTVEPGFGGQSFREDMLGKIREARQMLEAEERAVHLEVDGGIDRETAARVVRAGANLLVAGTSVFRAAEGPSAAVGRLLQAGGP